MFLLSLSALAGSTPELSIPYEKFTLDNGLEVILHQDRSDPIVAVATVVHVGSSREELGRTGFAHFFEHMSFNDSENVPRGANRKRIEELGGRRNGGTSRDYTVYYEVVPSDSLEKILWIDSDRLGYMINTVTEGALQNEKQVVKNEKRQRVDNAPYGHTGSVISSELYPEAHPYSWSVIGSLADLDAATLDDVRTFYDRWYGPNNATLVLAGDFEIQPTRTLIESYFGEIERGPEVADPEPQPVAMDETRSVYHLDSFAKLPELRLVFPAVHGLHEDVYALSALGELLAEGKRAPLYRELVERLGIAASVSAWASPGEVAGTFTIRVRAKEGVDLDAVLEGVETALADFAANGFDPADLARIQARQERQTYEDMAGVLDKARQLAINNELAGDPGYAAVELERMRAVDTDAVNAAFDTWLHHRPHLITSFVPKDQPELAVEGATEAEVVQEQVVKGAEAPPAVVEDGEFERTPTKFARAEEPGFGKPSEIGPPAVEHRERADGMGLYLIEQDEVPLVRFSVSFDGGHRTEPIERSGMASVLAELLNEGTKQRTPEQLEDAIGEYGASIRVSGGRDSILLQGRCLASQFDEVFDLAVEMLTEPRFDAVELERILAEREAGFAVRVGDARAVSGVALNTEVYGLDHPYGWPQDGTSRTLAGLTVKELKKHYKRSFSTTVTDVEVVGAVPIERVEAAAGRLAAGLRSKPVAPVPLADPSPRNAGHVVFIDVPGSKQSVLYVASAAMSRSDPAFFDLDVAHRRLGGGSSAQLFQKLRIDKGYTYGAYSFLSVRALPGIAGMYTSVRANVTLESLEILRDLYTGYGDSFDATQLEITRTVIGKSEAVKFETLSARLDHLQLLAAYDLPVDLLQQRRARLAALEVDDVKQAIQTWMKPEDLVWVVVGDGQTQRAEVERFGLPVVEVSAAAANEVSRE